MATAKEIFLETLKDLFGTTILWPADQIAAMPHVTADNKVIDDICEWKDQLVVPDACSPSMTRSSTTRSTSTTKKYTESKVRSMMRIDRFPPSGEAVFLQSTYLCK